ncbi:hypothetical protein CDAR_479011 [Caerostris darwini]|uniref:Uncharacterized protein n=1 Tax=Caerostris darwini TaxID=1538125 RepID=A0AAV4RQB0_9ARAC|nr:hypothetical protein CDAR_479011 [Caerostris darwini]
MHQSIKQTSTLLFLNIFNLQQHTPTNTITTNLFKHPYNERTITPSPQIKSSTAALQIRAALGDSFPDRERGEKICSNLFPRSPIPDPSPRLITSEILMIYCRRTRWKNLAQIEYRSGHFAVSVLEKPL